MNIASVLSNEPVDDANQGSGGPGGPQQRFPPLQNPHQYPTRHSMSHSYQTRDDTSNELDTESSCREGAISSTMPSPSAQAPKSVAFELILDETQKTRARIPMRVNIFPHDTTDSIVTTVKNFYGLYEGISTGVSFEDQNGNTLIARYENFTNNMTVFVRVVMTNLYTQDSYRQSPYYATSPVDNQRRPSLGEPIQLGSPYNGPIDQNQIPSRPASRVTRKRSLSPHTNRGRRSASVNKNQSRPDFKSRASSTHGSFADNNSDAVNGYSDSDGGHGSVSSSKKAKSEMTADINVGNILQEGRRKKAKFESSELPLFAPPQVPLSNSISSVSPQRPSVPHEGPSPFARPANRLSYQALPPSPYSHGYVDQSNGAGIQQNTFHAPTPPQHSHRLRDRQTLYPRTGHNTQGIFATPDPTIASCISDEDVALQLMRLGDASNMSYGRTSASTLNDDAFSGAADVASSTGATSEMEEDSGNESGGKSKTPYKHHDNGFQSYDESDASGYERDGYEDRGYTKEYAASDEDEYSTAMGRPKAKKARSKAGGAASTPSLASKAGQVLKSSKNVKQKQSVVAKKPKHIPTSSNGKVPILPAAGQSQSRKTSGASTLNFQHQLAADEEDLSSKPRCRRCRKSKKGCDRQRPCGRCKDAGIGIEGCVSEEEENGRKGRYGRHMGVAVKKAASSVDNADTQTPVTTAMGMIPAPPVAASEKSKKRKR